MSESDKLRTSRLDKSKAASGETTSEYSVGGFEEVYKDNGKNSSPPSGDASLGKQLPTRDNLKVVETNVPTDDLGPNQGLPPKPTFPSVKSVEDRTYLTKEQTAEQIATRQSKLSVKKSSPVGTIEKQEGSSTASQFGTIRPGQIQEKLNDKPSSNAHDSNFSEPKSDAKTAPKATQVSAEQRRNEQTRAFNEQQSRQKQQAARLESSDPNVRRQYADKTSTSAPRSDVPGTKSSNKRSTNHAETARTQQERSSAVYGSNEQGKNLGTNLPGNENVAGLDPSNSPGSTKFLRASAQENAVKSDLSQYSPTDGRPIPGKQGDFQKGQVDPGVPARASETKYRPTNEVTHGTSSQASRSEASAWQNQVDFASGKVPENAIQGPDGKYYVPGQSINLDGSQRVQNQEQRVVGKNSPTALTDNIEGSRVKAQELQPAGPMQIDGTIRPGDIRDVKADPNRGTSDGDRKPGAKLDVEINSDGKGKRIGLDGKEIIGLDGKSSPLYPNQKGKRITRFVDQGKKIAPGKKPGGKSKFDPKADLDPKERAQIDKIIKQTDRIFFGEKSPKAKGKSGHNAEGKDSIKGKGDKRSDSGSKSGNKGHIDSREIGSKGTQKSGDRVRGDIGAKSKGDVRSGINSTKVGKGEIATQSAKGDTGKSATGKGFGLPDYAPFPGLKLPEFKIKWPGRKGKVGDASGKPGKGKSGGKRGLDDVKSTSKGTGKRGIDNVKAGDKISGRIDASKLNDKSGTKSGSSRNARVNFESNTKSLNDNVSKLVSGSKQPVKLVRGLEVSASGKHDVRSDRFPTGRQASEIKATSFKPTKVSMGTRAHSDATFITSSIAIQPLDWSGIRGWFETRGILKVNKGQKGTDRRPVGKTTGLGVRTDGKSVKGDTATVKTTDGDTATVKTGSSKKAGDTATVKTGSSTRAGDTATVKTGSSKKAGDTATVKTDSSKKVNDAKKTNKKGDASSNKDKSEKKSEAKKGQNKKFELKESKDAYNGKLPSIRMTYKPDSGKVKSFSNKGSAEQSQVKPTKPGQKVPDLKPGSDAQPKQNKSIDVAANSKKAGDVAKQIQKDLRPVNSAKAGIVQVEPMTPRSMRDMSAGVGQNEVDPRTNKTIKSDLEGAKVKSDIDKGKFVVEGKDGRLILKELAMVSGLKGGFSRRTDRLLDGARLVDGANIVSLHLGIQQAKTLSIREVLGGLNFSNAKKGFTPEISESGSYKVTRNQSSAQLKAFGSSARHTAINFSMEPSSDILSSYSADSELESEELDEEKNIYRTQNQTEDETRKPYIVQVGDTIDSIAVVELNDGSLAQLIFELNKPLFQDVFDVYKQEHVKTLRTGTMILLPNKSDIENFKKPK